jgi:hypothetical protein
MALACFVNHPHRFSFYFFRHGLEASRSGEEHQVGNSMRGADGLLASDGPFLALPERPDLEDSLRLDRVIRSEVNHEEMGTAHPLVHGEFRRDFGLTSRLQGRRTDDRPGWSAPLHDFHGRVGHDLEGLVANIA